MFRYFWQAFDRIWTWLICLIYGTAVEYKTVSQRTGEDRTILLVGTTGSGKSATGNSILGFSAFQLSDGNDATHDGILTKSDLRGDRRTTVYDGLTIPDKRMTRQEAERKSKASLKEFFGHCPGGFDALVFVQNYDSRITEEEQVAVETFKNVIGESVWTDHAVLIFTHGESFELQRKRSGRSFEEWRHNVQDPLARKLISDFGNNVLLFYNEDQAMMSEPLSRFNHMLAKITEKVVHKDHIHGP